MKNEIREHLDNGIVRINLDELRYYEIDGKFYPSVTWILDEGFPKGYGFKKWLAALPDWETGQQILYSAGDRGSKVHWGISQLLSGLPISIDDIPYGYSEQFTHGEWTYLLSFVNFYEDYRPIIYSIEKTVVDEELGCAGTADIICTISGEKLGLKDSPFYKLLLDWKTSGAIYDSHKLQVAEYDKAEGGYDGIGIIRLGTKHKRGYQFWFTTDKDEIEELRGTFMGVYRIWQHHHGNADPRFVDIKDKLVLSELQLEVTKNEKEHENADQFRLTSENQDRKEKR